MAEFTPFQLARRKQTTVRRVEHYVRDLYNFSGKSVSHSPNPEVSIPQMGPHAAGAVAPSMTPQIESVEVIVTGSIAPDYGVNISHRS